MIPSPSRSDSHASQPQSPSHTLRLQTTLTPPTPTRSWFTAPHPTAPLLATCTSSKTVHVYSLSSTPTSAIAPSIQPDPSSSALPDSVNGTSNTLTGTLHSTVSGGHKRSIRSCAWKPNLPKGETVLATGSFDASVGIWRRYNDEGDKGGLVGAQGVDFNKRDREMEIGGDTGGEQEEEDDEEWKFAIVLDGHESEVKSVAWSAGGNLLATCSRDKSVWIWEEVGDDDYETVAVLQEHEGDVKCVAWHPEEELVVSGSYDDEVRLWKEEVDDWGCVGVLRGHTGTVWGVAWEGVRPLVRGQGEGEVMGRWKDRREKSGPRLMTCSDDLTVKVWRRVPKEKVVQSRYSIIRSGSNEEEWMEEARLPVVHTRPIYAVAWGRNGRVVSTGGDGVVVVYEERWKEAGDLKEDRTKPRGLDINRESVDENTANGEPIIDRAEPMEGVTNEGDTSTEANGNQEQPPKDEAISAATEWVVVAKIDGAHDVFEVNHVTWAPRPGKKGESKSDEEDLIVTTGDDGLVKVWSLHV